MQAVELVLFGWNFSHSTHLTINIRSLVWWRTKSYRILFLKAGQSLQKKQRKLAVASPPQSRTGRETYDLSSK